MNSLPKWASTLSSSCLIYEPFLTIANKRVPFECGQGTQSYWSQNKRMYLTVQDCVNQINDSVDQLSQAIKELKRLNKFSTIINDKVLWHISNVETWVSTALTDASSCVQSFPGHRMSKRVATIKIKAKNVAEVTSNALALFHSYATRHRQAATRISKKPWKTSIMLFFITLCLSMYMIHVFSLGGFT